MEFLGFDFTWGWIISVVVTFIVSAIFTSLWGSYFLPAINKHSKTIIRIVSLGLKPVQNSFYKKASQRNDNNFFFLMFSLLIIVVIYILFWGYYVNSRVERNIQNKIVSVESYIEEFSKNTDIPKETSKDDKNKSLKEDAIIDLEKLKKELVIAKSSTIKGFIIFSLVSIYFFWSFLKLSIVQDLMLTFDKYMNICLPVFKGNEREWMLSMFARIEEKKDYDFIMNELDKIIERGDAEGKYYSEISEESTLTS